MELDMSRIKMDIKYHKITIIICSKIRNMQQHFVFQFRDETVCKKIRHLKTTDNIEIIK